MGERERIRVVTAEIARNGCYLLTQRPAHAVLPHLWEFPGGKVRAEESDAEALLRALQQRIGCVGRVGELTMEVTHPYEGYDLVLAVYRCDLGTATPTPGSVAAVAWVSPADFGSYAFPGADQKTVDALLGREG